METRPATGIDDGASRVGNEARVRYHAIDKLRATMISIVMFGHALLPYVTFPRAFKDPHTHFGFDVVAIFLYSFAMQAFFLTAGFSSALILDRRGIAGLLRNRVVRILLPFLVAWAVLAPLTRAAYQFARTVVATQSVQAGIDRLLEFRWLDWSKIYHLWFLPALIVFTLIALVIHFALSSLRMPPVVDTTLRRLLRSRWRVAFLTLLLLPVTVTAYLLPDGDETTYYGVALFMFFAFGWLLYRYRDVLESIASGTAITVTAAVVVFPATVWATYTRLLADGGPELLVGVVAGIGNAMLGIAVTLLLLGTFQARFNQPSAGWRYVSNASYWVYLIHMPLVIFVAGLLAVTSLPAVAKYLLTVGIVLPIVIGSYHYAVERGPLGRVLIGGRDRKPA